MSDLIIISCTTKNNTDCQSTRIYQSHKELNKDNSIKLDLITNNKTGLPAVYNKKIEEYKNSGVEYLLFAHDDVYIDDLKLISKLKTAHEKNGYDIIGLAGGLDPVIKHPVLWHIMTERNNYRGCVFHYNKDGTIFSSGFGPTPSRVALIDGLFIAIHLPTILKVGWRFNENYEFHHYDLASCIDANRLKLKIGVYPIHVIHDSHGLLSLDDPKWKTSNQKFLKEYSR